MKRQGNKPQVATPERHRLHIRDLSYGPHGIGRLPNGKAVFARNVAPGEEVEVVLREERKTFAYAEPVQVLRASPDRRVPACEYLPRCGGCPWQHLTYAAQLRAKEQNVRDTLSRIGGIDPAVVRSIIASPCEFGYRRRISLRVEGREVGFFAGGTHSLVPVAHCLLAEPRVDAAIGQVRELVRRLASDVRRVEIASRGPAPGLAFQVEIAGALNPQDPARVAGFLADTAEVAGILLRGKGWQRSWGDITVSAATVGGRLLRAPVSAFMQVNAAANERMIEAVLELAALSAGDRVLELHAGAGNLTVPIAQRVAAVLAVEQNEQAAAAVRDNTAAFPHVEACASSAAAALRDAVVRGVRFDAVVLDPPRSGGAELVDGLLRLAARKIVYVSCNPATLARDLKQLRQAYRIEVVQPIDLFPHTYHVESIAIAVLT